MFARVVIDSPLPHLDRPFDYAIPEALTAVEVGTRVRVPFHGRLTSGLVVDVVDGVSPHAVKAIKSAARIPSLDPVAIDLAREIAARYGGSLWDVIRLMAVPRAASVEAFAWNEWTRHAPMGEAVSRLAAYAQGLGLPTLTGERGVWAATHTGRRVLPADAIIGAALAAVDDGGSAVIVAPDARAVDALLGAARGAGLKRWTARHGGEVAVLAAEDGPHVRYGSFLAAQRGIAPLVIGTRNAAWTPVPHLRHMSVWDEASALMQEPRAPYPHARTVAAMRSQLSGCSLLIAGHVLSADAVALVEHDFATRVEASAERQALSRIEIVGEESRQAYGGGGRHWMPPNVWKPLIEAARDDIAAVLVPQGGYAQGLACARCDAWAECPTCGGDLSTTGPTATPRCRDCGTEAPGWHCPECRGYRVRPVGLGVSRLAAQLRRMASGVPVVESSGATGTVADHGPSKGLVVATPGALPAVVDGYVHCAIVGARVNVSEGLGAEVQAVRRWLNAAALVRSRAEGGHVHIVGDLPQHVRTALIAWDGWDLGARDLAQRTELGLPPHRRALRLDGGADAIDEALAACADAPIDVSRDGDGAWLLTTRGVMPQVVAAIRSVAIERSRASAPALFMRVDAVPGMRG